MSAGLAGVNQIIVSWSSSPGASSYAIERSLDATNWSTIASGIAGEQYTDAGLSYSTTYFYRALAVSSAGTSAASSMVSAETLAQPDSLTGQSGALVVARQKSFTLPVATFTDVNTGTTAGVFTATIQWGDGRTTVGAVSGSGGAFTVTGTHKYALLGVYSVRIVVTSTLPDGAGVNVTSSVKVSTLTAIRLAARAQRAPRLAKKLARAVMKRAR